METLTVPKILETFDRFTSLKAVSILRDFQSMTVQGSVIDVIPDGATFPGVAVVTVKPQDGLEHRPYIFSCEFSKNDLPQLAELEKGQSVKISGKIIFATAKVLNLGGCRIEN